MFIRNLWDAWTDARGPHCKGWVEGIRDEFFDGGAPRHGCGVREHGHRGPHRGEGPHPWGGVECGPGGFGRGGHGGFGRGGHDGGFGRGGRGGFGWGPRGGFGFPMGRKLSALDLQLLLLALIGEKPRHGYDLIKAIEERSNGFYVPSPGVIYPALTYLEEAGDAISETDGSRKLFRLTELGQEHLLAQRKQADALLAQLAQHGTHMDRIREAFARGTEDDGFESLRELWTNAPELLEGLRSIRDAVAACRRTGRPNWSNIAEILKRAAKEIHSANSVDESGSKP